MEREEKRRVVINAVKRNGWKVETLPIELEVLDDGINVMVACRKAAEAFLVTEDGVEDFCDPLYRRSGRKFHFDWEDFSLNVPNEICEKFGFRKVDSKTEVIDVKWDDDMASEPEVFHVTEIQWAPDESPVTADDRSPLEDEDRLPVSRYIPYMALLREGETRNDVWQDKLEARIPEYLSLRYKRIVAKCTVGNAEYRIFIKPTPETPYEGVYVRCPAGR